MMTYYFDDRETPEREESTESEERAKPTSKGVSLFVLSDVINWP